MSKKPKEPPRGRPLHLANPGDVVELSHVVTGMQLGTITVHAGGRLETTYVWEE